MAAQPKTEAVTKTSLLLYTDSGVLAALNDMTEAIPLVKPGYTLTGWVISDNSGIEVKKVDSATVMPAATMLVKALWHPESSGGGATAYTLTFDTNGGTGIAAISKESGTVVDLSDYTTARTGFTFKGWHSDAGLTEKITSITLDKDTIVYAGWEPDSESKTHEPFINGYNNGNFKPDGTITRGEAAQMLYNLSGASGSGTSKFNDISAGDWY